MNRILSERESQEYVEKHQCWDILEEHGADFSFPLELFMVDGEIVGGVQGQKKESTYCIGYFFIIKKGKGYGRAFLKELKKIHLHLEGVSLPSSLLFWEKNGMKITQYDANGNYPFYYKTGA